MPLITVSVQRSATESGGPPRLEKHQIDAGEKASVLDALFSLQRGPCPDLAFRFSCRVGMCGSCAVVVNGRERLACSTLVRTIGTELRVEPLRNLPVTRDVAVDFTPFFDVYRRTSPAFQPRPDLDPDQFYPIPQGSREWKALNHQPQCIDCAACYSACTLVTLHPRYLGPMALNRALNLLVDPREKAHAERLNLVAGEAGAFRCHTLGNCRDVCPKGISPTHSIERIKRLAIANWLGDVVKRFFSSFR
jgi:succinate dehydrogenase / fumarate reductase iron-sulfur subunit/fumarate reductase iron-sulfur subunit